LARSPRLLHFSSLMGRWLRVMRRAPPFGQAQVGAAAVCRVVADSGGRRGGDDRVLPGLPPTREGGGGDLLVGVLDAGVVEVNDLLVGVDRGDFDEVIRLGALVGGISGLVADDVEFTRR
jgi:hypothetical protein